MKVWVIEWCEVGQVPTYYSAIGWTSWLAEAVRFVRQQDAETIARNIIEISKLDGIEVPEDNYIVVTEHSIWGED